MVHLTLPGIGQRFAFLLLNSLIYDQFLNQKTIYETTNRLR
jgi:hypothetical protein